MTDFGLTFLKDIIKEVGGDYARLAQEIEEDEVYVDTGSLILNALISGTLMGGVSANKITTFSGLQGAGKTFFSLAVVKNFLDLNPEGYCLYFDTEAAVTKKMLETRGIDLSRVVVLNVVTIEEFRTKALKAVDLYMKVDKEKQKPCMFVLDSLGMLSTNKEISDTLNENDKKDMTKAGLIKAAFRMLTLKLAKANIPMIVTNHVYANVGGYGPTQVQSGGSGMLYSASTIIELSKSKEKEGTDVVGNIIKAKTFKSRLSKENQEVEVRLYYDHRGLDRFYGLVELGEESGIIPRVGNRYEVNGKKIGKNVIYANPEEYFTPELLEKLDEYAQKKFKYGSSLSEEVVEDDETE
jgi:RecA/RadA recombinase